MKCCEDTVSLVLCESTKISKSFTSLNYRPSKNFCMTIFRYQCRKIFPKDRKIFPEDEKIFFRVVGVGTDWENASMHARSHLSAQWPRQCRAQVPCEYTPSALVPTRVTDARDYTRPTVVVYSNLLPTKLPKNYVPYKTGDFEVTCGRSWPPAVSIKITRQDAES